MPTLYLSFITPVFLTAHLCNLFGWIGDLHINIILHYLQEGSKSSVSSGYNSLYTQSILLKYNLVLVATQGLYYSNRPCVYSMHTVYHCEHFKLIYSTSRLIDHKYSIIKTINSKPAKIANKVEKKTQRKSTQLIHHVFV